VGVRFRKSFKLFPGVRINLSKSGFSASLGAPGATFNVSKRGVKATYGIPGSGLSYHHTVYSFSENQPERSSKESNQRGPIVYPEKTINSKQVGVLTSPKLLPLKQMIIDSKKQMKSIAREIFKARLGKHLNISLRFF